LSEDWKLTKFFKLFYKVFIRPLLFFFNPERAHNITFFLTRRIFKIPGVAQFADAVFNKKHKKLERELFGLRFPNPVGLAAGLDKNATLIDELSHFGFGFIEIGTVTPKPQSGNDKPRLFRLPEDRALINRMGFNNHGADVIARRLKDRQSNIIVGGNIGKNKLTSNEEAERDYEICFETLFDFVDYFVVNVSSPNTPNLRQLQEKEPLKKLLNRLQTRNLNKRKSKPILLKIAPDLSDEQLMDIIEIIKSTKIAGVIASNTTVARENLKTDRAVVEDIGDGGLSGTPARKRSTEMIKFLKDNSGSSFPIIGVGGICSAKDAIEKLKAGADLVQVYTGFIYEGPGLIKKINKQILKTFSNS